jgi:glycerophosphoryl diester phosphodiesterase
MREMKFLIVSLILFLLVIGGNVAPALAGKLIIAHRGASGYLPEHTLESYAMAYALKADYIEPDLVMTKDKHLICLHDITLERTTNVEEVFPSRKRTNGSWYAADFTLAEIKQLKAQERTDFRFRKDSIGFQVPTLEEMIQMIQELNRLTGRNVGIYPETKSPTFHDNEGLSMEEPLLALLDQYGYKGQNARVFIQSFEPWNLRDMRFNLKTDLPLVQLIDGGAASAPLVTEDGLDMIATYADGIGPYKRWIEDANGNVINDNFLVKEAHERDLLVHPWTFRAEKQYLTTKDDTMAQEVDRFLYEYGVDGLFTDNVDVARPCVIPTPIPGSVSLLALGLLSLGIIGQRKKYS